MSTEAKLLTNMYATLDKALTLNGYPEQPRICQHGQLARSCELCERDAEVAEFEARIKKLEDTLRWVMCCTQCPRPFRGRPDDWTASQCSDAKECGCVWQFALGALK